MYECLYPRRNTTGSLNSNLPNANMFLNILFCEDFDKSLKLGFKS